MVRFFGKTPRKAGEAASTAASKTTTTTPAKASTTTPAPRTRTTASTAAKAASSTSTTTTPSTTTTRRRTTAARPPRRDWAAEAAATPASEPAPAPKSLAASPSESAAEAEKKKRRRGTRGGRGRKKPGASTNGASEAHDNMLVETTIAPIAMPKKSGSGPATLEDIVAHQAAVLEQFTREVSATLRGLQTAIGDMQNRSNAPVQTAQPRVGIFVDVPNVIYAAERRNVTIDFGRVLDYFTRNRELVRASAYAPITDDPQAKLENQRFVTHFVGHPYRIITKPLKRFADGSMKANFDIELAIDILTMSDRLDVVVLMSGDGDFRRLVELIASRGVRVEVAAFGETASSEIKSVADLYIDLGQHLDDFKTKK